MKIINFTTIVFCLILLSLLIVFSNRGFDLTDEGFYLLKLTQDNPSELDIYTFQKMYRFLFGEWNIDALSLRIVRLGLTILSNIFLAIAIIIYIRLRPLDSEISSNERLAVIPFILLGAFASYGFGPQSISYNSMTANFIIITIAFAVIHTSNLNSRSILNPFLLLFSGMSSFIVLASKVPSGIILILVMVLFYLSKNTTLFRRILNVLLYFLGVGIVGALFSYLYEDIGVLWKSFTEAKNIMQANSSNLSNAGLIESSVKTAGRVFIVFAVAYIFYFLFQKWDKVLIRYLSFPIYQVALILLVAAAYYPLAQLNLLIIPIALIAVSTFIEIIRSRKFENFVWTDKVDLRLVILLFIGPYITVIGTTAGMFTKTTFSISLWFALFVILIGLTKRISINRFALILSVAMTFSFVVKNYLVEPYRVESLWNQNKELSSLLPEQRIWVDSKTYSLLENSKGILDEHGYSSGDSLMGITKLSGLIYLLKGHSLGGSYWGGKAYTSLYRENLERINALNNLPKFILYRGYDPDELPEVLKNDFSWPDDVIKGFNFVGSPGQFTEGEKNIYIFMLETPLSNKLEAH